MRFGLQAKFFALAAIVLLLCLIVLGILLQRQQAMQREVIALGDTSVQNLVRERLGVQAEAVGVNAADQLANPLYYFDLDAIGRIVQSVLTQPDVHSVTVYDGAGGVIHDGSADIARFGQPMADPALANILLAATPTTRISDDSFDIAVPIRIGDQRLGGVRIVYSLESVRRYAAGTSIELARRIEETGDRYIAGFAALIAALLVFGAGIGIVMRLALIQPIRQLADVARDIESGNFAAEVPDRIRRKNDEIGDLAQAFSRMTDGFSRHDREIRQIANTDALTGLANRRAFRERLDERVAASTSTDRGFAVVFADIDDFKQVNDTHGHDVGDQLLHEFAERIRTILEIQAGPHAMLARLGGDEFVLLVEPPAHSHVELKAFVAALVEAMILQMQRPAALAGQHIVLGT
ncbi:MAG: diguanylate cyclase [Dokdonella sp.]